MHIFAVNESFIIKEIKGESVLLNAESGDYFGLNSVGTDFIKLVDGKASIDQIIAVMSKVYDVKENILKSDINELIEILVEKTILLTVE